MVTSFQEMVQSRDHVIRGASAPVRIGAVRLVGVVLLLGVVSFPDSPFISSFITG